MRISSNPFSRRTMWRGDDHPRMLETITLWVVILLSVAVLTLIAAAFFAAL